MSAMAALQVLVLSENCLFSGRASMARSAGGVKIRNGFMSAFVMSP
ncbi:hypothetical protein ACWDLL_10680 [Streptomyces griseoincarnatus]|nr:hypothetical protein [Actinospica acidiphila]